MAIPVATSTTESRRIHAMTPKLRRPRAFLSPAARAWHAYGRLRRANGQRRQRPSRTGLVPSGKRPANQPGLWWRRWNRLLPLRLRRIIQRWRQLDQPDWLFPSIWVCDRPIRVHRHEPLCVSSGHDRCSREVPTGAIGCGWNEWLATAHNTRSRDDESGYVPIQWEGCASQHRPLPWGAAPQQLLAPCQTLALSTWQHGAHPTMQKVA